MHSWGCCPVAFLKALPCGRCARLQMRVVQPPAGGSLWMLLARCSLTLRCAKGFFPGVSCPLACPLACRSTTGASCPPPPQAPAHHPSIPPQAHRCLLVHRRLRLDHRSGVGFGWVQLHRWPSMQRADAHVAHSHTSRNRPACPFAGHSYVTFGPMLNCATQVRSAKSRKATVGQLRSGARLGKRLACGLQEEQRQELMQHCLLPLPWGPHRSAGQAIAVTRRPAATWTRLAGWLAVLRQSESNNTMRTADPV